MEAIHFIQDLAVILALAGVAGWLCQRMGLSTIVGYLVTGALVGPHTPPFALVTDVPRVETLAQLGLVFLMFSIGMRLSIRKLHQLGFTLLLAVCASAGIVFALSRIAGAALGFGSLETLFLAGMLMVSSSAIISKVLVETGATHEKAGQLAMGMSVLEDVVAVVMLTLLNSIVQFGDAAKGPLIGTTLTMLGAFIVLAGVAGMLLVPWLLKRMSIAADEELQTLGLAGLLFGLALLAYRAGYSTALGAFLLGTIVGETPNRSQVERIFGGMRSIFTAVFFVAIGMQIDPGALKEAALPTLGFAVFTILVRAAACSAGLTLIGTPAKTALHSGLMLLPIGEFSFIIAQLGVSAGVIPSHYYPMAVGLSLLTALLAPVSTKKSGWIAETLFEKSPKWLTDCFGIYHSWLQRLIAVQKSNLLWQLSRKRLIQIGVGMFFVTGLLVFSEKMREVVEDWLGENWLFPHGPEVLFWIALTLVASIPLLAIWRNLSAMAILYSELTTKGHEGAEKMKPYIEHGLRILAGCGMFVWLASVVPLEGTAKWMLLLIGLVAVTTLVFLRNKLIYWHSEVEVEIQSILRPGMHAMGGSSEPWFQANREWNLAVFDCVLPDFAACRGKNLRELGLRTMFGCTVVGIERQGFLIRLPNPETILYPRDKVLMMGTPQQLRDCAKHLQQVSNASDEDNSIDDVRMEKISLVEGSPASDRTLFEVAPAKNFGVQIAGVNRQGVRMLSPSGAETLKEGDELLVLGTAPQIKAFRAWLRPAPQPAVGA